LASDGRRPPLIGNLSSAHGAGGNAATNAVTNPFPPSAVAVRSVSTGRTRTASRSPAALLQLVHLANQQPCIAKYPPYG
jgi:hypothetical protein